MKTVNEVHLAGHAGKDAEVKYTTSGKSITKFSLATGGGRKYDGSEFPTDWHRVVAWGDEFAEVGQHIRKGTAVEVFGRIAYGSYERNGQKVYTTDIVAVKLILPDADHATVRDEVPSRQLRQDSQEIADEGIPF